MLSFPLSKSRKMKQRSSFLSVTWSFLSLFAAAGLCTAGPLLQPGALSLGLDQHQALPGRQVQSSPSQPRPRAPPRDEVLSPSGPASRSRLPQSGLQHPSLNQRSQRRFAASQQQRATTGVCTFTVSQVQVCTPDSISAELVNYLQVNTLYSPYGTEATDIDNVRHQRPIAEYNSYQRLLPYKPWEVTSVEGDSRTLTIVEGEDGHLRMSYGGAEWTEDTRAEDEGAAWCEEAEWYEADDWSCPHGNEKVQRKRTVHCGFPCARIERLELK